MTPTTSNGNPYPADTDAPDGPTQIKALAEALNSIPAKLLATECVESAKIKALAVTTAKIAAGAVTPEKTASQQSTATASEEQNAPTTPMVRLVSGTSATIKTIKAGFGGQLVTFVRVNTGTVTFKDGLGNLNMAGDFAMTTEFSTITFVYDSVKAMWHEVCRSLN